jgi:aryl-alcohol dehydrogenase-like predicted oxidoreductase
MSDSAYRSLGRSGLIVSPLSLGTMTFGADRWGADEPTSAAIFDAYIAAGGNLLDTADIYSGGQSEEMLGRFITGRGLRERVVLATKSGFNRAAGNPNAGGNGAKNIRAALETSLRRLQTDYVDLYWLHVHDMVTPAEEVLETLQSLVRAGKIRYFGLSNVPAWYAAKMAALAAVRGGPAPIAVQFEYSLASRGIEREVLPMASDSGMGLQPWGPLAAGLLTGKYGPETHGKMAVGMELPSAGRGTWPVEKSDRLSGPNPFGDSLFTDRNWEIVAALRAVAGDMGRPMAEVALAWVTQRPGVSTVLIGASRAEQVGHSFAALDIVFTEAQRQRLDDASAPPMTYPDTLFTPPIRRMVFGGVELRGARG